MLRSLHNAQKKRKCKYSIAGDKLSTIWKVQSSRMLQYSGERISRKWPFVPVIKFQVTLENFSLNFSTFIQFSCIHIHSRQTAKQEAVNLDEENARFSYHKSESFRQSESRASSCSVDKIKLIIPLARELCIRVNVLIRG